MVSSLAGVSFGIYLSHAVFLEALRLAAVSMKLSMSVGVTGGVILLAFLASGGFALYVPKTGRLGWLVR